MTSKTDKISDKLRGGYYTPAPIAQFIADWAIRAKSDHVLEPSCGDGNFIEAALVRLRNLGLNPGDLNGQLTGVELIKEEASKTLARGKAAGLKTGNIKNQDFFSFVAAQKAEGAKYDVVIGNPPFIRYQNFPAKHRDLAISLMNEMGLSPNKMTNIWVPFLVVASSLLNREGRLGMVIPAELFQVKYAQETRVFLSNFFESITIVTFKKLVFDNIQQEVVLLLCQKTDPKSSGIRTIELENLEAMQGLSLKGIERTPVKKIDHSSEKWIKYFLEQDEIDLLRDIRNREDIHLAQHYLDVDVGIVTGRNKFFMLDEQEASAQGVQDFTQTVVSRSQHLEGITFTRGDLAQNLDAGITSLLFTPPDLPFEELPAACKRYIRYGEKEGHHKGYKCRTRKRWYVVPSLGIPDAFALRQINEFPKLILNSADASSTDTIHRVKFLTDDSPKLLVLSFLNSLTFAFSEITGRSYGGGVMTFEPTEIEDLPLPVLTQTALDYDEIDRLMRQKKIRKVLDLVDAELLVKQYGFSKKDVLRLRAVWDKLSSRRMNRKKR
ncbi:adenine-specific DNA-methyltransferase [Neolewinella xylanilytica]|uniref:site-specific DNA-methyltransferase (adenine-specific) n=1 Tax=Neolewinella xylanilytica TaxID=1514080 RepID=A0A2S6HZQ0_9BACT|nr:class I SAM-dependent methyltransferase [Neolewinella xylanilytica]PPK83917.1 adenine-specific DNA-methyltransferase [Neolewinella xylanilytica]